MIDLRDGVFFLERPNQLRGDEDEGGSKGPEVESDLDEGRCFHMGEVGEETGKEREREGGENEAKKENRRREGG